MKTIRVSMVLVFIAAMALPLAAANQRSFVSTTGSDLNPCTRTSPCRGFAAAIANTLPNGEVVVLDTGGYAAVTITQSVAIEATGVTAGIAIFGGSAVTVNAGPSEIVVLRGLTINSLGGSYGVLFSSGKALSISDLLIMGADQDGIATSVATGLTIKDTTVIGSKGAGVSVGGDPSTSVTATLDRCRLEGNTYGLAVFPNGHVAINDSVATSNVQGIVGSGSGQLSTDILVERCVSAGNDVGIRSNGSSGFVRVRVSNSTITHNTFGLISNNTDQGQLISRVNNSLEANTTDGLFTSTYLAK